ncbi:MAG: hypothetical protein AAF531_11690 [Actinomycetota bacterium]
MTFVVWTLIYAAVLLAVSGPALFMAWRRSRIPVLKRFVIACVVGGAFCGIVTAGSKRLVDRCEAEGNPSCFDAGADGMILLFIVGFLFTSLLFTYILATDYGGPPP